MAVENTLFSERKIHLVASVSDSSEAQVDYCFVWRDQKKFVKDLKVAPRKRLYQRKRYGGSIRINLKSYFKEFKESCKSDAEDH